MEGHYNLVIPKQLGSSHGFSGFERGSEGDPKAWDVVATLCSHIYSPSIKFLCHLCGFQIS